MAKENSGDGVGRRDLLKGIVAASVAAGGAIRAEERRAADAPAPRDGGLIQKENARPGTREWMLRRTRIDPSTKYRCPWIEGYASASSVRRGETLTLHVSTRPASTFTVDLYRMGCYGGDGGRLITRMGSFQGKPQEDPPVGKNRLRECAWEPSTKLVVGDDWISGLYLVKLSEEKEGLQSYIPFVVRDDRSADFILQVSDTTWQAYNRWPSQYSLYDDGKSQWYWGPDVTVSFDRPCGKYCQILDAPLSIGSGEWFLWEFPLAFWLESRGEDVTYVSNIDTHADRPGLARAKGFLSVGHDEYYTIEMFENLKSAIASGLNVAFLSGNTCCGLIGLEPAADGRPHRRMTRLDRFGPKSEKEAALFDSMGRLPFRSPSEASLIGARSTAPITGGADWVCAVPDHWLFKGTGMKQGEGIPGLVGWEWHGDPAAIPGLEVVATGPTTSPGGHGVYTATMYPGPKGNIVFNASSCWWADGLSEPPGYLRPKVYTEPKGPDLRAQQITANLLSRMKA